MSSRLYTRAKGPFGFGDLPRACSLLHTASKDSPSTTSTSWPLAMVLKPHTSKSRLCPAPAGLLRMGQEEEDNGEDMERSVAGCEIVRQFSCGGSVPPMGVQRQSQRMERPTVSGSLSGGG